MKEAVIKVENLSKRYRLGQRGASYTALRDVLADLFKFRKTHRAQNSRQDNHIWALKDVSFEVKRGEVIGIIGRNGAGKTTLLKIFSRITEPTEGRVEIKGRIGSLLEVGTGFHPELTGGENIFLNGAILGMRRKEIKSKFDEIVSFAEVKKFIDTPVKFYSSGMYMRLAFAVAAHLETEILLVDEVLAVGDVEFQKKCLGKMGDVAKGGRTVLFVSHNMLSLQNLCAKGILLESGMVSIEGSINTVIDKYLDLGRGQAGEVHWVSPNVAPGDERVRLKAVRVVSGDCVTGMVDISKEIRIEIDYWNLETNSKRNIFAHLYNSMGICVFASGNASSISLTPDEWFDRPYPSGLFRTSLTIPACFLNDGLHYITVFINASLRETIICARDILSFVAQDTGVMRREYTGEWLGIVRPRLDWHTVQLE